MDPATIKLLTSALMSFGPAIFNRIFGGDDPQQKLLKQTMALLSPQHLAKVTEQIYQQNIASPAYSQAQRTIAAGANATSNLTAQNLAARGIGTTGTGAVLSSLTPSLVGNAMAGIRTQAYDAAGRTAQQNIGSQIDALKAGSGPSDTRKMVGAGIENFQPYLQAYLRSKGWLSDIPTVAAAK